MLEIFATTVQAELNATLHVCESGLQDIRIFLGLVPKESPCTTTFAKTQFLANGPLGSKHIAIKINKNTVLLTVFT
jgi:hypothetical protein